MEDLEAAMVILEKDGEECRIRVLGKFREWAPVLDTEGNNGPQQTDTRPNRCFADTQALGQEPRTATRI